MRITFLLPGYPWKPIGGFKVVYEYANHLVAKGHDVTIVHARRLPNWTSPPPLTLNRRLRRKVSHLRDLIFKPKVDWLPIDHRIRMIYVSEPKVNSVPDADAIFATWWATAEIVLNFPSSKGKKFYLIQHYETWGGPKERVDNTWQAPLLKIVISKWLYKKGLELGALPNTMIHIPNGINHSLFQLKESIEERPLRIAMMYSDMQWKGTKDGIKALELAKKQFPSLEAILFGTLSRPFWLPNWIYYLKNPPQKTLIEQIYNNSSIYLSPSWTEGWCLPGAEAMACGCAFVCSNSGGVNDYAVHEETALISSPKNPKALSNDIVRLFEDDALRIKLAKSGHEHIKRFSWERSANTLHHFLLKHVRES